MRFAITIPRTEPIKSPINIQNNIRKFFIDFRISGYPRSRVWHDFTSEGIAQRVKVPHDIVYGGSLGFFF